MELILALIIKQPHGLKGAVKALCLLEDANLLVGKTLTSSSASYTVHHLQQGARGFLIVHLKGISTPEQAKVLGGTELFLDAATLPALDDYEVYLGQLIGKPVHAPSGQTVGHITNLQSTLAHELAEVAHAEHGSDPAALKPFLVPLDPAFFEDLTATPLVLTELGFSLTEI